MLLPLHTGCQLLELALAVLREVCIIKGSLLSFSDLGECNWSFNVKINDGLPCERAVPAQDTSIKVSYLIDISLDVSFIPLMFLRAAPRCIAGANDEVLGRHTRLKKKVRAQFPAVTNP